VKTRFSTAISGVLIPRKRFHSS